MTDIDPIKYPVDPASFIGDEELDRVKGLLEDIKQHRPYCTPSQVILLVGINKHGITRHQAKVIYEIAGRIKLGLR